MKFEAFDKVYDAVLTSIAGIKEYNNYVKNDVVCPVCNCLVNKIDKIKKDLLAAMKMDWPEDISIEDDREEREVEPNYFDFSKMIKEKGEIVVKWCKKAERE